MRCRPAHHIHPVIEHVASQRINHRRKIREAVGPTQCPVCSHSDQVPQRSEMTRWATRRLRGRFEIGCQAWSSCSSNLASFKSSVSKPSVNQP